MAGVLSSGASAAVAVPGGQQRPPGPIPTPIAPPPSVSTGAPTPAPPSTSGIKVPPQPTVSSLYTINPGAGTFAPSSAGTATPVGKAPVANASTTGPIAGINNGQINPNDATNSASQLDAITNANSPYIQLAKQQGLLSAGARGLENSSMGAGASEAAAVAAAAPLAEQNASGATTGRLQDSQLQTQASEFNASQQNVNQQLDAQLSTQEGQFNASQAQAAAAANTAAKNSMTQQTMALNEQINQQYLAGSQSQTLAGIQGQYNELISTNQAASSLYGAYFSSIAAVAANQNIAPQRLADTMIGEQSMLSYGLGLIDAINGGSGKPATMPTSATYGSLADQGVTAPAAPGAKPPTPSGGYTPGKGAGHYNGYGIWVPG